MIAAIIRWSIANRVLVLVAAGLVTAWGVYALRTTPVDALPDLSDVQVIIKTRYPGQAPQVVEQQVTYPLTTAMLSALGGVGFVLIAARRTARSADQRARQRQAYADWLAARFSLGRVTLDYVGALRALKQSVRDAGAVAVAPPDHAGASYIALT